MVVYADIVLGINFIVNTLLLYLTGWVSGGVARWPRLLAAAGLGGLYALSMAVPAVSWLYAPVAKALVSWLMVILSFGARPWRRSSFMLLVFYLESFLLGGAVLGWTYLWEDESAVLWQPEAGAVYGWGQLVGGIAAAVVCTILVARRLLMRAKAGKACYPLVISLAGRKVEVEVILDTGNSLYTPVGRRPVIPIRADALAPLFSTRVADFLKRTPEEEWLEHLEDCQDPDWMSRLEFIPCRSIHSGGLMLGFRPDLLELGGIDARLQPVQAVVGIIDSSLIGNGGSAGLLHPALLGGADYS